MVERVISTPASSQLCCFIPRLPIELTQIGVKIFESLFLPTFPNSSRGMSSHQACASKCVRSVKAGARALLDAAQHGRAYVRTNQPTWWLGEKSSAVLASDVTYDLAS